MSSSDRPETCLLTLNVADDIRLTVYDGAERVIFSGFGSKTLDLPRGLYTIRTEHEGQIEETVHRHTAQSSLENLDPPRYTVAPLAGAANTHEYYAKASASWSRADSRPPLGAGPHRSRLFLFIRCQSASAYQGEELAAGLTLRDARGRLITAFESDETFFDREAGCLALSAPAAPGVYILCFTGETPRELRLQLFAGWETQVFLLFHGRLLLSSFTLLMASAGHGFQGDDEGNVLADLALKSLQNQVPLLRPERLRRIVKEEIFNPVLGLAAMHLLLREEEPVLLEKGLAWLREALGPAPDVRAVEIRVAKALKQPWRGDPLSEPPMLLAGFQEVVRLSIGNPELIAEGSLMEEIAPRLYADSPWTTWEPLPVKGRTDGTLTRSASRRVAFSRPASSPTRREAIALRIRQIRNQIEETTSDYEREKLQERLAKFVGGVAVIRVGAATEVEMKEKKARIEDAMHATQAAVEEGIVPGGGVALLRAVSAVEGLWAEGDVQVGINIVRRALEEPARQIAINAGEEGSVVVKQLLSTNSINSGFNAATGKFEDLVMSGVIDPAKVTKTALLNAASIAGLMLTTEAMVSEIKEKEKIEGSTSGPGGGMGGMY